MDPELQLQLIMFVLWLFLVYRSAKLYMLSVKSVNWNKTKATITTSSFDRSGNTYSPKLIYEYSANKSKYMNDTYTFLGASNVTKSKAIKIAEANPKGSEINIYFNSENPQQSVIIPGVHWEQYSSFAIMTMFLLSVAYIVPILNFIWPGCQPNCT